MKKRKYKVLPKIEYYKWQKDVLATKSNLILRSGRQVGKSEVISEKCKNYALSNPNKTVMVIAFVERQALLIFSKILNKIHREDPKQILGGQDKPTKHKITLKNGTEIYCFAAGETGYGIMGYTIDLLIADEAAFINEEVWNSVIPTLAATQGIVWLLSTPKLKEGFYWDCFEDDDYANFHESSEDCPHITPEFLAKFKKRFTKSQYSQMILGEFLEGSQRIFSDEWIEKVCILEDKNHNPTDEGTLGVDIAGMGDDESAFEGFERIGNIVKQFHHETTTKTMPTETEDKIKDLNAQYNLNKIGIDDGGMGVGVLAHLLRYDATKRKVVGLNNSRRFIDSDEATKLLYKEAMYMEMLLMGQRGELQMFNNDEVRASLRSVISDDKDKIGGMNTHIAEGMIRGVWFLKQKDLNLWITSIPV